MDSQIFICYSHYEEAFVRDEVQSLLDQGYSVYYDERVHPGAEWADELAEAIAASSLILFFASAKSVQSIHCKNEIAYAVDLGKPVLTVFQEPLELSGGLKLTISRSQAIARWQLNEDEYHRQLNYALLNLSDVPAPVEPGNHVWRIPSDRNAGFVGRQTILADLGDLFKSDTHPVALVGQAGIGKTQIALEFAYSQPRSHSLVGWVRAEDPATLVLDLVQLATDLGLTDGNDIDTPQVLERFRRWLNEHNDWFIILDNVESPDIVRRFIPSYPTGNLLITSRQQTWGRLATTYPIEPLTTSEAVDYILSRTGLDDSADARRLAETLGNLPLALEEASAYIDTTGRSIAAYIELFERHHEAMLPASAPPDDYQQTLWTTLGVSLGQLDSESAEAATLLRHLAFLAPENVSFSLLHDLPVWEAADTPVELVVDQAIGALRKYSLIKVDGNSVSSHRLTQLIIRDRLTEDERQKLTLSVLDIMLEKFPRVTDMIGETGNECRELLPHALTVLTHARSYAQAAVAAGTLLGRTGTYMSARNLSADASQHLAEAYQLFRDKPEHKRLFARTCELYARILYANGFLEHSRQVFQEALQIFEEEGPSSLVHLMQINLDISWVMWTSGDFRSARSSARRSLELMESVLGSEDPHRAISLSMISRLEIELGNTQTSRAMIESVVSSIPKIPTVDRERTPLLCAVFLQTAQVLRFLGSPSRARSWSQESLLLGKPVYSEHHTLMGATHCVLGQALMDMEDFGAAREELGLASKCAEEYRFPVNQHVFVGVCYEALTLVELGELEEADQIINSALVDMEKRIAGESAFARAYADLARGWLARQRGEPQQGLHACEAGDQAIADKYGESSPFRLYSLLLRAVCERAAEHLEAASESHRLALEISEENGLDQHPHIARHLEELAVLCDQEDKPDQATTLRQQALDMFQETLGPSSPPVSRMLAALGRSS